MKSKRMACVEHVACMGELRIVNIILVGNPIGKRPLERLR
jgi:hypothetical protein